MNQKKAKQLRSVARSLTIGQPERGLVGKGTLRNHPATTRSVYRNLKKAYRLTQRRKR